MSFWTRYGEIRDGWLLNQRGEQIYAVPDLPFAGLDNSVGLSSIDRKLVPLGSDHDGKVVVVKSAEDGIRGYFRGRWGIGWGARDRSGEKK